MPPLPFLENQPELAEHLQFEWRAFGELSNDRSFGFGEGPIPWTSFDRYAIRYGIDDPDEFDRFCNLMRAMDDVYLEHRENLKPKSENK